MTRTQAPPAFALPAALRAQGYALRSEAESDTPFLTQLYASTREDELAPVPWTAEQKAAFLAQQFAAQRHHYRTHNPTCRFEVIQRDGVPVGRLYLEEFSHRLHIVDIALLPACRGHGLGTQILEAIHQLSRDSGRPVTIMVEKFNPARRLYARLGYAEVEDHNVYLELEWRPGGGVS